MTAALAKGEVHDATKEKFILEESQRNGFKERKIKMVEWVPKLFERDDITSDWIYKHMEWVEIDRFYFTFTFSAIFDPLQDEGLSMMSPNASVRRLLVPICLSPVLLQLVSPSFSLPSPVSLYLIWCPVSDCWAPAIVIPTADVARPIPFPSFHCFKDVLDFCLFPDS